MQGHSVTWTTVALVGCAIAGVVALAAVGDNEATALLPLLIGMLAPVLQNMTNAKKLDQIDSRLNGGLDERIEAGARTAVREVLEELGLADKVQKQ